MPAWARVSRRQRARSASLPTSTEPISSERPRMRAPSRVAISSAARTSSASGPPRARANNNAWRSSSTKLPASLLAAPSTPSPTGLPAARRSAARAIPAPRRALELGQCATPVPDEPNRSISASEKWMPCANHTSGPGPAEFSGVLQRGGAEVLAAVVGLVGGLGEVGVQPDALAAGQFGGVAHEFAGDAERRAGRDHDLQHRVRARVVPAVDRGLGRGQDLVAVLDHRVRRQPAVLLAEIHRSARRVEPQSRPRAAARISASSRSLPPGERRSGDRPRWCSRSARAGPARPERPHGRTRRRSRPTPGRAWSASRTGSRRRRAHESPTGRGAGGC